jgi:hypothetical protein
VTGSRSKSCIRLQQCSCSSIPEYRAVSCSLRVRWNKAGDAFYTENKRHSSKTSAMLMIPTLLHPRLIPFVVCDDAVSAKVARKGVTVKAIYIVQDMFIALAKSYLCLTATCCVAAFDIQCHKIISASPCLSHHVYQDPRSNILERKDESEATDQTFPGLVPPFRGTLHGSAHTCSASTNPHAYAPMPIQ